MATDDTFNNWLLVPTDLHASRGALTDKEVLVVELALLFLIEEAKADGARDTMTGVELVLNKLALARSAARKRVMVVMKGADEASPQQQTTKRTRRRGGGGVVQRQPE